jgi:flagellar protein FliO/FliZ
MEFTDYTRFFLALAFVVGLIWALATIIRKLGLDKKMRGITGGQGRLAISEVLYLDPKRKVIVLRADAKEYLLLVSGDHAQLIDKLEGNTHASQ